MHCGNNIKLLREIHNYTQLYVAKSLNISLKTYRKIEKTKDSISPYYVNLIEKYYGVSLKKFIHMTNYEIKIKIFYALELHKS